MILLSQNAFLKPFNPNSNPLLLHNLPHFSFFFLTSYVQKDLQRESPFERLILRNDAGTFSSLLCVPTDVAADLSQCDILRCLQNVIFWISIMSIVGG